MASVMAAMLDELMGKDRDLLPDEKPKGPHWDDDVVCRSYLCGFCPHDLFTNTKSDLGQCVRKHDDRLREKYEQSSRFEKCGYEGEFLRYLESLVEDMDRKIKRGRQRLANNTAYREKVVSDEGNDAAGNQDIARIEDSITVLLKEVEELGQQGEVDEAQRVMRKIDRLKREKEERQFSAHRADLDDYEKRMEVCDTCGAFLVINDTQIRLDAHLSGKQHLGFTRVRAKIEELKKALTAPPSSSRHDSERSQGQERRRDSYQEPSRDRDRDRGGSSGDYDRYRSRDRDRGDYSRDRGGGRYPSDSDRRRGDHPNDSDRRRDRHDHRDRDRDRERERSDRGDRSDRSSNRRSRSRERPERRRSHRSRSRERSTAQRRRSEDSHRPVTDTHQAEERQSAHSSTTSPSRTSAQAEDKRPADPSPGSEPQRASDGKCEE